MSDTFELIVTADLRDELSEPELAELRWHLGLGPQPEQLTIVREFPVVVLDDAGNPAVENAPEPLLAGHGPAQDVGGALCAALERRDDDRRPSWALTSRREIHPDEFEKAGELLCWLADRLEAHHRLTDGAVWMGYFRFHEELLPHVLEVTDGHVNWDD
ncbi:hypothetical protein [Streptacidiphilus fuscans]|uniref:Uncharacterized protein n=1 Tax=Streptacidiphilus fuscans TaxID=2789292 RepID=A0A931FIY2_9ACTN|nr:hypothetical protein [Streptacidiphilus fuscans]MBF9068947.1 hypothetical protein [Streptacidiphilus fuscans]MBF9073401.1 hypothetical protein [Streptacidiphilus fuscans]